MANADTPELETSNEVATELTPTQATAFYREQRAMFRQAIARMKTISKGTAGLMSTGDRMFWASVLFTRLMVAAQSIAVITPPLEPKAHWDFSAVASLSRNFIECYFVFHFLCLGEISDDERHARFLMMHIHDNFSRNRMLSELGQSSGQEIYEHHKQDLEKRISETRYFNELSDKQKKVVLRGDRTPFIQDDILEQISADKEQFRGFYRLLSSHTHTGPISIYRMADHGRGAGVENHSDKIYIAMTLEVARTYAALACEGIASIFPNAERRGATVSDAGISKHIAKLQAAQMRGETIEP